MDSLSAESRSERMSRVRGKNTGPELAVRRLIHALGYRFRLHRRDLPGTPDLVFSGRRKVTFVHGCFWHRHPDPDCRLARMPKSRQEIPEAEAGGESRPRSPPRGGAHGGGLGRDDDLGMRTAGRRFTREQN